MKLIAWWLVLTKDSKKHHKSEKLKKKLVQKLSSNASEVLIDQQVQTEQRSENNSEKVFTEKNKNWYETVLQKIKKLEIKENENLMTCE